MGQQTSQNIDGHPSERFSKTTISECFNWSILGITQHYPPRWVLSFTVDIRVRPPTPSLMVDGKSCLSRFICGFLVQRSVPFRKYRSWFMGRGRVYLVMYRLGLGFGKAHYKSFRRGHVIVRRRHNRQHCQHQSRGELRRGTTKGDRFSFLIPFVRLSIIPFWCWRCVCEVIVHPGTIVQCNVVASDAEGEQIRGTSSVPWEHASRSVISSARALYSDKEEATIPPGKFPT